MLYLTRREGQAIIIDNTIEVRVVEVRGRNVKLGLTFPSEVSVLREEVFLELKAENEAAALAGGAHGLPNDFVEGMPRPGDPDPADEEKK